MQIISTLQAKEILSPRAEKDTAPTVQPARKTSTPQPTGLTREEVRQIIIDMIG
ncbi:hypothetical protein AB4072_13755 [Microvirga sp. 2MCAF38]|uniref:hypothetical protein n=1 Tax=Microvirga sp. 2MCAF38 TaxID=3232989 RepID=UPI003F95769B